MDDLSSLLGGLGNATGGSGGSLAGLASAVQAEGGLDGLLGKLNEAGLGDQVSSWVGTGANQPIDADQLGAALGPDEVQRLSSGSGIDIAALLPMLAAFLPQIIDMLTPDGNVPEGGLGKAAQGQIPDIGGMLGGLGGMLGPKG
jgi:uncharacterized protein YidB (DUF937 family)